MKAFRGAGVGVDYIWLLAGQGRLYIGGDAAAGDLVTAVTTFATTTPTFQIDVPADTTCIPLFVNLSQSGTVAGGAIDIIIEIDNADRYNTGGTAETIYQGRTAVNTTASCTLRSNPTGNAGYGMRVFAATIGPDVSPAEGAVQGPFWQAEVPYFIEGPGAFNVFTYAAVTAPTWLWSIGWAEVPTKSIPYFGTGV